MTVAEFNGPLTYLERVTRDGTLEAAVNRQRLGTALGKALHALSIHADRLRLASVLADLGPWVGEDLDGSLLESMPVQARQLIAIGKALEEATDEAALVEVPARLADAKAPIDVVQQAFKTAWYRRLAREFEPLRALARVPGLADDTHSSSLDATARVGLDLRHAFPPDPAQRAALTATLARRDELIADLERAGVTPAIREFLLKAMDRRATLADLNAELLEWLDARQARGSFRIGLADDD